MEFQHYTTLLDDFSKVSKKLKIKTTSYKMALQNANNGDRALLNQLFDTMLVQSSLPAIYWSCFDDVITSKAKTPEDHNTILLYKTTFAKALLEYIRPFRVGLDNIFLHSDTIGSKLEEFFALPTQTLGTGGAEWYQFVIMNESLNTMAHDLPFNVPFLLDLMSVVATLDGAENRDLARKAEKCVSLQMTLMYMKEFCAAQMFVGSWKHRCDNLCSDYKPEELTAMLLADYAVVVNYLEWCYFITTDATVVTGTEATLRRLFKENRFFGLPEKLGQTATLIGKACLTLPSGAFNELIPLCPGETKKFVFVEEPSTCLICLETVTLGISPCNNAQCGLSVQFNGPKQYCHYSCFRSHAWSFQYENNDIAVRPQSIRCMLCKSLFSIGDANLELCQLLPLQENSPKCTNLTLFDGQKITFSVSGNRTMDYGNSIEKTDS